jgi:hypothetical protein
MTKTVHIDNSSKAVVRIGADDESLLISYIKAHLKKAKAAEERAQQNLEKAEQHYASVGSYLTKLKATHTRSRAEWEALLKEKIGLSTGRASELMQIADGRKNVQQIRAETAQRVRALRDRRASSLQVECNEEKKPVLEMIHDAEVRAMVTAKTRIRAQALIIDLLDADVRKVALRLVHSGEYQDRYDLFRNAVAEIYQQLMRR